MKMKITKELIEGLWVYRSPRVGGEDMKVETSKHRKFFTVEYGGVRITMDLSLIHILTKRYRVTTLLLSQISNQSQREGYNASVDGFKGAGDIGQVANVAMRIRRERDELSGEWDSAYGLHITKIRHAMPSNLALTINFPGGLITQKSDLDI